MLTVVLSILRILGIVLLCLLGTVLVILLLVLFWPVTYSVRGRREPDGTDENGAVRWDTEVRARFKWLLGFVNGGIDFPEPGKLTVRVLWFTVFSLGIKSGAEKKTGKADKAGKSQKAGKTKKAEAKDAPAGSANAEKTGEKAAEASAGEKPDASAGEASGAEPETASRGEIAGLFEKIRYTISDICAKIKEIRTKEEYYRQILTEEDTRELFRHVLMRLGRLLRAIRPRHVRADVRFGTGSPDTTGYALAVYGMACPRIGWAVNLTPDFEEKVLEGKGKLSGHLVIGVLLWHAVHVALDRRLHRLIRRLKSGPPKQ